MYSGEMKPGRLLRFPDMSVCRRLPGIKRFYGKLTDRLHIIAFVALSPFLCRLSDMHPFGLRRSRALADDKIDARQPVAPH